ncbi:MAG: hypothetical protein ACRDJI_03970 [Actinomycetota bacterium]
MNDLERRLEALGGEFDWPPVPNVARAVTARLEAGPARREPWWRPLGWHPAAVTALALVVLVTGVVIASPGARDAVADWLGIGGVRIEFGERVPSPRATVLDLGEHVSLTDAESRATFDVLVPASADIGEPDEIYFDPLPGEGQVSLVYDATPGLPDAGNGFGLLINEFKGGVDESYFKKIGAVDTKLRFVEVNGVPGYWIAGAPHSIAYIDANGNFVDETVRLAGNVLLWEQGGVTFRIESLLTRAEALAIASSLR